MTESFDFKSIVKLTKSLAGDTRLKILEELIKEEICICKLSGILNVSQPTVSAHIQQLEESGLINLIPQGREKMVELNPKTRSLLTVLEMYAHQLKA